MFNEENAERPRDGHCTSALCSCSVYINSPPKHPRPLMIQPGLTSLHNANKQLLISRDPGHGIPNYNLQFLKLFCVCLQLVECGVILRESCVPRVSAGPDSPPSACRRAGLQPINKCCVCTSLPRPGFQGWGGGDYRGSNACVYTMIEHKVCEVQQVYSRDCG